MENIQCHLGFNAPFLLICNMKLFTEVSDIQYVPGQYQFVINVSCSQFNSYAIILETRVVVHVGKFFAWTKVMFVLLPLQSLRTKLRPDKSQ